jgi:hypothetical protein
MTFETTGTTPVVFSLCHSQNSVNPNLTEHPKQPKIKTEKTPHERIGLTLVVGLFIRS